VTRSEKRTKTLTEEQRYLQKNNNTYRRTMISKKNTGTYRRTKIFKKNKDTYRRTKIFTEKQ